MLSLPRFGSVTSSSYRGGHVQQKLTLVHAVYTALQVLRLKSDFQQRIREAEALKLQLARAEETLSTATGEKRHNCRSAAWMRWPV